MDAMYPQLTHTHTPHIPQANKLHRPLTMDEIKDEYLRMYKAPPPKSASKSKKRLSEVIDMETGPSEKKVKNEAEPTKAKSMAQQLRKWALLHQQTALDMYKLADEMDA